MERRTAISTSCYAPLGPGLKLLSEARRPGATTGGFAPPDALRAGGSAQKHEQQQQQPRGPEGAEEDAAAGPARLRFVGDPLPVHKRSTSKHNVAGCGAATGCTVSVLPVLRVIYLCPAPTTRACPHRSTRLAA